MEGVGEGTVTKLFRHLSTILFSFPDARSAAAAVGQVDPDAREDLITYLKAFNEARAAGD